jgi:hypothetical protein
MSFKKPISGGMKKARESFEKFINQQPSDRLVQIIEDVLVENEKARKKPDVAAKGIEPEANT